MNKTFILLAGVAVVAVLAYGVLSVDQGADTNATISSLTESTSDFVADATDTVADTTNDAVIATEEFVNESAETVEEWAMDITNETEDAYQAAVEQLQAEDASRIQPAAGDAEADADANVQY